MGPPGGPEFGSAFSLAFGQKSQNPRELNTFCGFNSPGLPRSYRLGVLSFPRVPQIQTRMFEVLKVSLQKWRLGRLNFPPPRLPQHHTDQTRMFEVLKVSLQKWRLGRLYSPKASSASHGLGGLSSSTIPQNSRLGGEGARAGVRTRACVCVCVLKCA